MGDMADYYSDMDEARLEDQGINPYAKHEVNGLQSSDSDTNTRPSKAQPKAMAVIEEQIMDALQEIEIFPHGVNYKPAVEALAQYIANRVDEQTSELLRAERKLNRQQIYKALNLARIDELEMTEPLVNPEMEFIYKARLKQLKESSDG